MPGPGLACADPLRRTTTSVGLEQLVGALAQRREDAGAHVRLGGFVFIPRGTPSPQASMAEAYGTRYWRGRFRRILLPLRVVSAVALVAGAASGHLHVRALALVGWLPVPGPGVYWITILLTFTLIWPAWMHLFRLRPGIGEILVPESLLQPVVGHPRVFGPHRCGADRPVEIDLPSLAAALGVHRLEKRVRRDGRPPTQSVRLNRVIGQRGEGDSGPNLQDSERR